MIKTKEKEIRELLKVSEQARKAFDKMLMYYQLYDKFNYTSHVKLLKSIYLDTKRRFCWQLENIANIGRSTCFEYRKKYIKYFYICLSD